MLWIRVYRWRIRKVLTIDDLAKGDNLFFCCTGITEGDLLSGVNILEVIELKLNQ